MLRVASLLLMCPCQVCLVLKLPEEVEVDVALADVQNSTKVLSKRMPALLTSLANVEAACVSTELEEEVGESAPPIGPGSSCRCPMRTFASAPKKMLCRLAPRTKDVMCLVAKSYSSSVQFMRLGRYALMTCAFRISCTWTVTKTQRPAHVVDVILEAHLECTATAAQCVFPATVVRRKRNALLCRRSSK